MQSILPSSSTSVTSAYSGLDFNDADPQVLFTSKPQDRLSVDILKQRLHSQLRAVLFHLFPLGEVNQPHFVIGNVQGEAGESLKVELSGPKIGMWHDFATSQGGDILSLWGAAKGLDPRHEFPEIISSVHEWLGTPMHLLSGKTVSSSQLEPSQLFPSGASSEDLMPKACSRDLGPPTGRWYYKDAEGNLLAYVYRYDTAKGKEFRPWDVKTRSYRAPNPRPLYNQPGMVSAETVIIVEGEKCAQTLIDLGLCATTAMNGAKAPLDKTDWSPLKGKQVIIWPDNDVPGQEYANRLVTMLRAMDLISLSRVSVPQDKPESWDAADAFEEGFDIEAFLQAQTQPIDLINANAEETLPLPSATAGEVMTDTTPSPQDWIAPRILTPGGLLVLGGAPKVGKTDMILSWLAHMAAGLPFLGMIPPRPLKIFYLQTEIMRPYLRERLQNLKFDPNFLPLLHKNLVVTFQVRLLLNEDGVNKVYETVKRFFKPEEVDVLVIDPLRNIYDAGKSGSENDNMAMLAFLQDRIEKLRALLNPTMGVILTHHTKKVTKAMVEEDPFQALSGAGSLRSFYTTGMLLFKADEKQSARNLMFELRNGEAIQAKLVDKIDGTWQEMSFNSERIIQKEYGAKLDAERHRRHDVILQLIFDEASEGHLYTPAQFRETFEGHAGLGGERTIHNRLSVLATKGYIKFNLEADYRVERSKYGVMCVEGMEVPVEDQTEINAETGEVVPMMKPLLPTHFKESQSGAILPVENPEVWVYLD